ncbi:MAG TPA: hypothetical protein VMH30_06145 [Verrucomicrobiae bacterium]|nr:hypothetical protein [Verrucomicrobiae bacterium]
MLVKVGKSLLVLTLVAMLGAQWTLLQTVAWTTMLANNLRTYSFSESVSRTFDGQHPCPLCRAIAAGKKSERKNDTVQARQKLEFPLFAEQLVLIAPSSAGVLPRPATFARSLSLKPPTPPPRALFA